MKKMDSIALTSIAAEKMGMSYGKYVAKFGVVPVWEEETIPAVGRKICQECGCMFLPRARNMKFCSEDCRKRNDNRKFRKQYRQRSAAQ